MQIRVNYEELNLSGQYLKQKASQYEEIILRMYTTAKQTSNVWQGQDQAAFIQQMEQLQPKLKRMIEVIQAYSNVLITSSNAYAQLQQNRIMQARNL